MKNPFWLIAMLFLFVAYATRIDIPIKKLLAENISVEFVDMEQNETDGDDKENESWDENEMIASTITYPKQLVTLAKPKLIKALSNTHISNPITELELPPPKI